MKLYMMVTKDEYELPLGVYDSIEEMAEKQGLKKSTIVTQLSRYKHNAVKYFIPYRQGIVEEAIHDGHK